MAGIAFIAIPVCLIAYLWGVALADAMTASAISCTTPAWASVTTYLLGLESYSWLKGGGVLLAIAGNAVMAHVWAIGKGTVHSDTYYLGVLCLFINIVTWAFYLVWQKPLLQKIERIEFLFRFYLFGCGFMLVVVLAQWRLFAEQYFGGRLSLWAWGGVIFAGGVNSTLAYYLLAFAIESSGSSVLAAVYNSLQPLFVTVIAVFLLGEELTFLKLLGGCIVLSGIAICIYAQMMDEKKKRRTVAAKATVPDDDVQMQVESPRHEMTVDFLPQ